MMSIIRLNIVVINIIKIIRGYEATRHMSNTFIAKIGALSRTSCNRGLEMDTRVLEKRITGRSCVRSTIDTLAKRVQSVKIRENAYQQRRESAKPSYHRYHVVSSTLLRTTMRSEIGHFRHMRSHRDKSTRMSNFQLGRHARLRPCHIYFEITFT